MNVELLRKIKQRILRKPDRFDMNNWFSRSREYYGLIERVNAETTNPRMLIEECGTTACIAGWACILGEEGPILNCEEEARRLLGLTWYQSRILFFENKWPTEFRAGIAESNEHKAMMAAKRIDHFIATEGRE